MSREACVNPMTIDMLRPFGTKHGPDWIHQYSIEFVTLKSVPSIPVVAMASVAVMSALMAATMSTPIAISLMRVMASIDGV